MRWTAVSWGHGWLQCILYCCWLKEISNIISIQYTLTLWVLLKAGPWPSGPRRPAAQSWFSTVFCPAVTPRTCTDLHRVWVCNMDDREFKFVYHFNNHLNPFRLFLSLLVVKWKTLSFSVYSSVDRTRERGIALSSDSNDLMVNEFKLTVVHAAHPNPM